MQIAVQQLAVSQYLDTEQREAIRYAAGSLADWEGHAPLPVHHPVHLERVTAAIRQVRDTVRQLTDLAAGGHPRGAVDIAGPARKLAHCILPGPGFVSLIGPNWHPQFDLAGDIGGEIPWEVLEENFAYCQCAGDLLHQVLDRAGSPPPCPRCRQPMQVSGGKLALERHLTHLVRYSRRGPLGAGRDFLMVIDPTADLLSGEADPTGACREHVAAIQQHLESAGFNVKKLARQFATIDALETELRSPTLMGLYYFGHGEPPEKKRPGALILHDGKLYADDIVEFAPTPRLVFLNACWGGSSASHADWDNRASSVGEAFARGGRKVVIAALFPVVNTQAARLATRFFAQASADESLADILLQCRRDSFEKYQAGEADVGWMAYRYFGDPNQTFPKPETHTPAGGEVGALITSTVFDENDRLVADQFGFDMRSVLLRAAGRRERQRRQLVTMQDLFAGLLRCGQLTRLCWRDRRRDADEEYESLRTLADPESETAASETTPRATDAEELDPAERLWRKISRWIVRQKSEFTADAIAWLDQAGQIAAREGRATGDGRVTERDMLRAVCISRAAAARLTTFDAPVVSQWLEKLAAQDLIDANGCIRLDSLAPSARRIVERAHELSQQRGQKYIPSRLLLAAFFSDSDGVAARLCAQIGVNPKTIKLLLIALTKGETPVEYPLSLDSCRRIVLPTLQDARRAASRQPQTLITDEDLFRAFCRVAPPELKRLFRPPITPFDLDLDRLATLPLAQPDAAQPDLAHADGAQPDAAQRDAAQRDAAQRDAAQRDAAQREAAQREAAQRDAARRDRAQRERGGAELGDQRENPPPDPRLTRRMFDDVAERALKLAVEFAQCQGYDEVRSPHLFAGLLAASELLAESLREQGLGPGDAIAAALRSVVPKTPRRSAHEPRGLRVSENVGKWLEAAAGMARDHGDERVGERHLLDALTSSPSDILRPFLQRLRWRSSPPSAEAGPNSGLGAAVVVGARGWDLTALARRGSLPPLLDRADLLDSISANLVATPRGRLLLRGAAGVGKTSLMMALARRIAGQSCHASLADCRIIQVSAAELTNRGLYPAEGWTRWQCMVGAVTAEDILVVDDLEPGLFPPRQLADWISSDCAARLVIVTRSPPPLAATTTPEFTAFEVRAAAPTEAATLLRSQLTTFERRFEMRIEPAAVDVAIRLADARHLPGSAARMLEDACRNGTNDESEPRVLRASQLETNREAQ